MKAAGYYDWREFSTSIGGRTIRYASKPGLPDWDRTDRAAQLLAESIAIQPGERLLDLRSGQGVVAAYAAACGAQVAALDDNFIASEATRRTFALNGIAPGDPAPPFDVVALTMPKGRDVLRRLVRQAARALKPGGRVYLSGANRSGIKSAIDDLDSIVGNACLVAYGKGQRVATATRTDRVAIDPGDDFAEAEVEVKGERWRVVSAPGVFAHGRLDEGTRRLIEAVDFRPGESLLDLGCGCGIIGLVAAHCGCRVTCVDASATAVESTRRTLSLAGHVDADVLWGDCASAVADRRFDAVVTNPPFHQGIDTDDWVSRQFMRDAAAVLRPGGRLVLVANRFLRYEREMDDLFSVVRTLDADNRFCVYEAVV